LDLKDFKAVIFDLFHTLTSLESTKAPGKGTSEILGVSRKSWYEQLLLYSEDRLRGKIRDPLEIIGKMARAINPDIPDEIIKQAVNNRIKRFKYALEHIEPSTIITLARLRTLDKLVGLVSNSDSAEVAGWKNSPIKKYFDSVVFSCDVGYIKPEKEIYEICLKKLGVLSHECVFVGDGGCGELRGAKELGMTTVLTTHVIKHIWPEKIKENRKYADYEIGELKELLE
jgi:putative hydrolase of the HAD superfamily